MSRSKTCFFTGHRKIANDKKEIISLKIKENIERLINEYEVDTFISGAALGFDTIAAECVIELKKRYPHIRLLLYLPCYGQSRRWSDAQQYRYRVMLSTADEYKYITHSEYTEECMYKRNMEMVKDSCFCIAFCILSASGAGLTLRNAELSGIDIINIADEIYD